MKKLLVLVALASLVSTSAFALIANTKHDLSTTSTGAVIKGTSTEICVYCHTPHGASSAGTAPLWNRIVVNATGFYGNPAGSMNAVATLAGVNASDAILCLSCHDGSSLNGALNNPPNTGGTNPTVNVTGNTSLSTDLSNDHPIGFIYADAAVDTEIQNTPLNGLNVSFGSTNNQMWCSSCHDVHNNANGAFLMLNNAGSALCLSCHIK
jgi:predicted CXXCH cytochrome family protein